jgi:hypothetical protein
VRGGEEEGRPPVGLMGLHIRALLEQEPHDAVVPQPRRPHERGEVAVQAAGEDHLTNSARGGPSRVMNPERPCLLSEMPNGIMEPCCHPGVRY